MPRAHTQQAYWTRRRGSALLLVMFAIAVASVVVMGVQASAFRQAASGRETAQRIRAYWAARAGLESTLARLEYNIQNPDRSSAFTLLDDLTSVSVGSLEQASWRISHTNDTRERRDGPADPHEKVNINRMTADDLMTLPGMTEDVADAILDWIDSDEEPRPLGAEIGFYANLPSPYEPRNGPITSLFELELIAGVTPELVRGEDWNLNGVLDPEEDDGDASWPPDNADGLLDAGWSRLITAQSTDLGLAASGRQRLDLKTAAPDQLMERVPTLNPSQAQVILEYGARQGTRIEDLIGTTLASIAAQSSGLPSTVRNLDDDQIRKLLDECTFQTVDGPPVPGRVNVNTVSREVLDSITSIPAGVADALIAARDAEPTGFAHIMDLLSVPSITARRLSTYSRSLTVESNAWVISSRGKDDASGVEAEIVAVIDRTSLPVSISEMRVR